MNDDLPVEVDMARRLLRDVEPRAGAEVRIYRRTTAPPIRHHGLRLRFLLVSLGLLLSASAALGFGLAPRLFRSSPSAADNATAGPSTPRQLSRKASNRAAVPRRSSAPTTATEEVRPLANEQPEVSPSGSTLALKPDAAPPKGTASAAPPNASGTRAERASELSRQVEDYRAAVAELEANPTATLARLQAYRRKWPHGALLHEVDLRTIQVLVALGRERDAETAAKRFLAQYPNSARAAEVLRIAPVRTRTNTLGPTDRSTSGQCAEE